MNAVVENLGACRKKITITIPVEDVNKEYQGVLQEFRKKVAVPGFRKGKASISTIKRRFKREMGEDVKEKLLTSSFKDALVEHKISPVGSPDIDAKSIKVVENEPVEYVVEVEHFPSIEIANYKGVEMPKPDDADEIPEEHIQMALENIQRQNAINEPIDDAEHVIAQKDSVTVNYQRTLNGEPFGEPVENYTFWLGVDQVLPEFVQSLLGKKKGEHVEFSIEYPADFEDEKFAGKSMQFTIDVIDVENVVLPELDDEFAKDLELDSLEMLKEKIREDLTARLERDIVASTKNKLLEKIVDSYDFELPPSLVKDQQKRSPQRSEEDVIKMLRAGIILATIREQEQIEVTDDEVNMRLNLLAMQYQVSVAAMTQFLEQQGGLEQIRSDIAETKTLDFLYEQAQFVEGA